MLRVGLTGGIATGKSYVRARLEALGARTIDADLLARDVVAPGTPGLAAIAARFGPRVLDASGRLDRASLAEVVFGDTEARRELEAIVHPRVYAAIDAWFASLIASGRAPSGLRMSRSSSRPRTPAISTSSSSRSARPPNRCGAYRHATGRRPRRARRRLAAQWPIEEKARQADYVIRTDGTFAETDAQVEDVYRSLCQRAERVGPD